MYWQTGAPGRGRQRAFYCLADECGKCEWKAAFSWAELLPSIVRITRYRLCSKIKNQWDRYGDRRSLRSRLKVARAYDR
jgi:hypothetical protein